MQDKIQENRRVSLRSKTCAILLRNESDGFALIVSILDITVCVVFILFASSLWEIFFFILFSINCFANKYSGSDSSQVFLNLGFPILFFQIILKRI